MAGAIDVVALAQGAHAALGVQPGSAPIPQRKFFAHPIQFCTAIGALASLVAGIATAIIGQVGACVFFFLFTANQLAAWYFLRDISILEDLGTIVQRLTDRIQSLVSGDQHIETDAKRLEELNAKFEAGRKADKEWINKLEADIKQKTEQSQQNIDLITKQEQEIKSLKETLAKFGITFESDTKALDQAANKIIDANQHLGDYIAKLHQDIEEWKKKHEESVARFETQKQINAQLQDTNTSLHSLLTKLNANDNPSTTNPAAAVAPVSSDEPSIKDEKALNQKLENLGNVLEKIINKQKHSHT